MALLWLEIEGSWRPALLAPAAGEPTSPAAWLAARDAELTRSNGSDNSAWVLLALRPTAVHLNGAALVLGLAVLSDRDEIRFADGSRAFFSSERLASLTTFVAGDKPTFCPRCKDPITGGPAVCCPCCSRWYHEDAELGLNCWTYSPECVCGQPTALDAGYQWTPDLVCGGPSC